MNSWRWCTHLFLFFVRFHSLRLQCFVPEALCVSCALGVLGGPVSGWDSGCSPVWILVLSRPRAEEALLWGLHQDGLHCYQTTTGLSHSPGASLHHHGRGEGWEGEGGIEGGVVLSVTRKETCWSNLKKNDLLVQQPSTRARGRREDADFWIC